MEAPAPRGADAEVSSGLTTALAKGDVTLTANTALYSSKKIRVLRKVNDLSCAKLDLVEQLHGYTQLM